VLHCVKRYGLSESVSRVRGEKVPAERSEDHETAFQLEDDRFQSIVVCGYIVTRAIPIV